MDNFKPETIAVEQALGADLAQEIRDFVNQLPEEGIIKRYFAFLSCQQWESDYFCSVLDDDAVTEEQRRNLELEMKANDFKVQCFQERFPQFKGTWRVLMFCPGYGLRECIVSDDPTFTPIWGDFPPPSLAAASGPSDENNPVA